MAVHEIGPPHSVLQHSEPAILVAYGRVAVSPTFECGPRWKARYPFASKSLRSEGGSPHDEQRRITKLLNKLRAEYDLPPKFDKGLLMTPREATETQPLMKKNLYSEVGNNRWGWNALQGDERKLS